MLSGQLSVNTKGHCTPNKIILQGKRSHDVFLFVSMIKTDPEVLMKPLLQTNVQKTLNSQ